MKNGPNLKIPSKNRMVVFKNEDHRTFVMYKNDYNGFYAELPQKGCFHKTGIEIKQKINYFGDIIFRGVINV